jgi:hypothetical protein
MPFINLPPGTPFEPGHPFATPTIIFGHKRSVSLPPNSTHTKEAEAPNSANPEGLVGMNDPEMMRRYQDQVDAAMQASWEATGKLPKTR